MMLYCVAMQRRAHLPAMLMALLLGMSGVLAVPADGQANEVGFVDGFEDLPLMPGLAVDDAAGVLFEKPTGRIVETVAGGRPGVSEIRSFYDATLPELGWQPVGGFGGLLFRRSQETLQIEIHDNRRTRQVRFFLTPG